VGDLKNGDRSVKCFVVYPERKDKAPVVPADPRDLRGERLVYVGRGSACRARIYCHRAGSTFWNGSRWRPYGLLRRSAQSDGGGEWSATGSGHGRSQRGLRVREDDPERERQTCGGGFLLGRRANRSGSRRTAPTCRGVRVLRHAADVRRSDGKDQGAGVRVLRGNDNRVQTRRFRTLRS